MSAFNAPHLAELGDIRASRSKTRERHYGIKRVRTTEHGRRAPELRLGNRRGSGAAHELPCPSSPEGRSAPGCTAPRPAPPRPSACRQRAARPPAGAAPRRNAARPALRSRSRGGRPWGAGRGLPPGAELIPPPARLAPARAAEPSGEQSRARRRR